MPSEAILTIEFPPLHSAPSSSGGHRFTATLDHRGFAAVCRQVPGRLVHTRTLGGVRVAKGWTKIDVSEDIGDMLADLLIWVATGMYWRDKP